MPEGRRIDKGPIRRSRFPKPDGDQRPRRGVVGLKKGSSSLPDILPLAGGVAIKRGEEIVAALGVGGAPGGEKDEACAEAGVAIVRDRVASAPAGALKRPGN
jgi:hypothetical protein